MRRTIAWALSAALGLALAPASGLAQRVTDQGVTDLQTSPWAFQKPSNHGGNRTILNNDLVMVVQPADDREITRVLSRIGLIPGITTPHAALSDGDAVFMHSMLGIGFRNLHAVDSRTGEVLWQSGPWLGDNDSSAPGPMSGPGMLDIDGRWIVVDDNDIFAYDKDTGQQLWQTGFDAADGQWLSYGVFSNGGDVVFFHNKSALLAAYDRATGELQWTSDVLTGIEAQPCVFPRFLTDLASLVNGVWPPFLFDLTCGAFGQGLKITESQALDPRRNNVSYMGSAEPEGDGSVPGAVYAIRILTDENGDEVGAELAWQTEMAPGTGTSPTINLDDDTVLGADGDELLQAHALEDGTLVWIDDEEAEGLFSPAVSQERLLLSSDGQAIIALDAADGSDVWKESYEFLIPQVIPPGPPMPPFTDGEPTYSILSGLAGSIGDDATIGSTPLFGYEFQGSIVPGFNPFVQASIRVRESDGTYVEGSLARWRFRGTSSDVGLVHLDSGYSTGTYAELQSVFYNVLYNPLAYLPYYRQRQLLPGGTRLFEPADYDAFVQRHLDQLGGQGDRVKELIGDDSLQEAYNQIRWARRILDTGTPDVVEEAVDRNLTSCPDEILAETREAEGHYADAKASLFGDPDEGDKADAVDSVEAGQASIANAIEIYRSDECDGSPFPGKVVICHKGQWTRVVPPEEIDPEFDTLGPCEGSPPPERENVLVCFNGKTKNLPPETAEKLLDAGGTLGPCE